jgi:hypothetical protein
MERCEMQVFCGSRREARLDVSVDTDNPDDMRDQLLNWLEEKRWSRGTWPDFSADFYTRRGRKTVRADP